MYAMPCDLGMTWDGTDCAGTRLALSWNNGTSNWTTLGSGNSVTGRANTLTMDTLVDAGSPYPAATNCYYSTAHGFPIGTWHLPARDELDVLFGNRSAIGGFTSSSGYYWTSSESSINNNDAWRKYLPSGGNGYGGKGASHYVRCIRR
jgi:hypothetical protein